jgi:hypothetical protein
LARSLSEALKNQKEAVAKVSEGETEHQRELQEARQQVKQAQDALKAAGEAKKAGVDISSLVPPLNKFDGAWRVIYMSEECSNKRREFIVTIKNGMGKTQFGAAKASSTGDFTYSGKNLEGAIFSYTGKIADKSGGGKVLSRRPEKDFSCSGTFTMTKLD